MSWRKASWQWQLVLIMMLVSGIALLSFISVSWQIVRMTTYKKVDAELVAFTLKQGWSFVASMTPDRQGASRPRTLDPDEDPRVNSFGFYNIESGFGQVGPSWPEEIDVAELGKTIPALYEKAGKNFPKSRFIELQRTTPEERAAAIERRQGRPPRAQLPSLGRSVFTTVVVHGNKWRVLGYSDGIGVFLAAHDMSKQQDDMHDLRQAILLALPIAIIIIGLIAYYLAGKAIYPVKRLTGSASTITAESLSGRLQSENEPPEFAKLIQVYNQMLDRLEKSFGQATRFSADAAHELNTPLTILRGHLDLMLQSAAEDSESQQQLAMVFDEVRGLQEVIQKLLLLSQADSGRLSIEPKEINYSLLISEILEDAEVMAPEIQIEGDLEPDVMIKGDRDLLRQCVFNLVTNAIKYNHPNGSVKLILRKYMYNVELDVINTGKAIPVEKAGKVFERFFRVDPSRDAKVSGRGLGLSLAKEFARAHHGTLELAENEDERITFRLVIPLV